jgi:hypothetical protein
MIAVPAVRETVLRAGLPPPPPPPPPFRFSADTDDSSLVPVANPPPTVPAPSPPQPPIADLDTISTATSRPRFVGDLNPESVFLTSAAPQQRDLTECGVWSSQTPETPPPHRAFTQNIPRAYLAYLDSIGAFSLPTPQSREGLISIFFASVNSLLPFVHESTFRAQHADSTVSVPLLHAVLLVAARHPASAKHLPPGASARSFAATTADKVAALLHIGIERDRVTLTRIHALLALHSEGPGGNEAASLQLSTAIHHAYSLGLHLHRAVINREEQELWWVLWMLDSLQASLCGRPVGVRREDVSVPTPVSAGTWFDASLRITDMLADVIALYRPGNISAEWESEWTPLSSLIPETAEGEVADTLRLFYHAVSILSHRSPDTPTPSPSYLRRLESAQAILRLFAARKQWPPFPVVPYAMSLALTTFYSILRRGEGGARESFVSACEILEALGTYWWFAGAMAKMGRGGLERLQVKEAAGALRDLGGGGGEARRESAGEQGDDGIEAWFLQFFPDLAAPVGWVGFGDGWDAGGGGGGQTGGQGAV